MSEPGEAAAKPMHALTMIGLAGCCRAVYVSSRPKAGLHDSHVEGKPTDATSGKMRFSSLSGPRISDCI